MPTLALFASNPTPRPGSAVVFTATASGLHGCHPTVKWDFDGDGPFDDAVGVRVTHRFANTAHDVVWAELTDCIEALTSATNVWVRAARLGCASGKQFDLIADQRDANGALANPQWRWQCAYPGFPAQNSPSGAFPPGATYPDAFPDLSANCNQFHFNGNGALDVGTHCTSQHLSTDVPTDPLWYAICHFIPDPPFQEANDTVHGHVNYMDVTYTGSISVQHIQSDFPFGDGDVDLDMRPTNAGVRQELTQTMPGVTLDGQGNAKSLHLEFNYDEALQAFPDSAQSEANTWATALASLAPNSNPPSVYGMVTGLFGLDSRHGSYSEVHPVYGLALREASGRGFERWLILARNGGDEGGCSSHTYHWLTPDNRRLTLQLPLPSGPPGPISTAGSYYSANFTGTPIVNLTSGGGTATVTVQLPPTGQYGVVAGELDIVNTAVRAPMALRLRARAPAALPLTVPTNLEPPEQLLASLNRLVPASRRAALAIPLTRAQRAPMTAAQACAFLTGGSQATQATVQQALVKVICKAGAQP